MKSILSLCAAFACMLPTIIVCAPQDNANELMAKLLTSAEQEQLNRNKILVSKKEVSQSFSVYLDRSLPTFITSDVVLNTYHVIFEQTLRQQEKAHAQDLEGATTESLKKLVQAKRAYLGDAAQLEAARARGIFVLSVAVKLLDGDISLLPKEMQAAVVEESLKIEAAQGQHKPIQLGPVEPDFQGFDYTVFRPVGFYAESLKLRNYFRATRWLQLIPHRLNHNNELLSYLLISDTGFRSRQDWNRYGLQPHGAFMDGFSAVLESMGREPLDEQWFKQSRALMSSEMKAAESAASTNDRLRTAPTPGDDLRILPSIGLPEDEAFWKSSEVAGPPPSALEFASWLDFPLANQLLLSSGRKARKPLLDATWPVGRASRANPTPLRGWDQSTNGTVCWQHLKALRGLWQIDDRAPAFMKGVAWKTKTLQTISSSWAQQRHTWSLQQKMDISYNGIPELPTTFIEPVPDFFDGMAGTCQAMAEFADEIESKLGPLSETREEIENWRAKIANDTLLDSDRWQISNAMLELGVLTPLKRMNGILSKAECAELCKDAMDVLSPKDFAGSQALLALGNNSPLSNQWRTLAIWCYRLAVLANKQISSRDFTTDESDWLAGFGSAMGQLMLYKGNSFEAPRDDAARVARLASDPKTGEIWHVGIGRPRVLFVLYPWRGTEILCRGSVMPYHETVDSVSLTDEEWRQRFKGETRPPVPLWLKDLVPVDGVKSE